MTEYHNPAKSIVVGNASPVENRIRMVNPAVVPPKIWAGFAIAALFLSGGLASCSDRTAQSPSTTEATPTTNPAVSSDPNSSSQTISGRNFLTMMTVHHQQALEMSNLALTRAKRPEIKQLAQSIITDQKSEIQTMATLYKAAYGTEIPAMGMGGGMMDRDGNQGMMQMPMNGMNGMKMDMNTLRNAADFDREFLRQMIAHHQSASQMSQMVLRTTKSPEIRTLAESIIKAQTAEIGQMRKWYQTWYKATL